MIYLYHTSLSRVDELVPLYDITGKAATEHPEGEDRCLYATVSRQGAIYQGFTYVAMATGTVGRCEFRGNELTLALKGEEYPDVKALKEQSFFLYTIETSEDWEECSKGDKQAGYGEYATHTLVKDHIVNIEEIPCKAILDTVRLKFSSM